RHGGVDGLGQHVAADHHAGAAARGRIVHGPVTAEAMVADVFRAQGPEAAREGVARQRKAERAGEHLRVEGDDGGGEGHGASPGSGFAGSKKSSGSTATTRFPAMSTTGTKAFVKGRKAVGPAVTGAISRRSPPP